MDHVCEDGRLKSIAPRSRDSAFAPRLHVAVFLWNRGFSLADLSELGLSYALDSQVSYYALFAHYSLGLLSRTWLPDFLSDYAVENPCRSSFKKLITCTCKPDGLA